MGRTNRTSRSEGAVELIYHLERANPSLLVPYVSSFIRFLGQLIEENNGNTKVIIHILEIHSILLESFLTPQSVQKQEQAIIQNLFEIGLESKTQVTIEHSLFKVKNSRNNSLSSLLDIFMRSEIN